MCGLFYLEVVVSLAYLEVMVRLPYLEAVISLPYLEVVPAAVVVALQGEVCDVQHHLAALRRRDGPHTLTLVWVAVREVRACYNTRRVRVVTPTHWKCHDLSLTFAC